MKKMTKIALASAALLVGVNASAAQSYTVTSNTVAFSKAGSGTLDLTKFNTTLGTLTSVEVNLFSDLNTTVKVENTSKNSPSTITANVSSTLKLPTLSQTVVASGTYVFNEAKYDLVRDFGGTSGGVHTFPGSTFNATATYSDAPTLALFSGVGLAHLGLDATTASSVVGTSGNTSSLVLPSFDSYAKVTYTYTAAPVPEPETYAMLLAGLGLVGFAARKRKAK